MIVHAVLTQTGIPDFPICGQSGPRFPFPAKSGIGDSLFPDSGQIGNRGLIGFLPRFPAKSGIGGTGIGDFRVWDSCPPGPLSCCYCSLAGPAAEPDVARRKQAPAGGKRPRARDASPLIPRGSLGPGAGAPAIMIHVGRG
jgi:hypothetical protein